MDADRRGLGGSSPSAAVLMMSGNTRADVLQTAQRYGYGSHLVEPDGRGSSAAGIQAWTRGLQTEYPHTVTLRPVTTEKTGKFDAATRSAGWREAGCRCAMAIAFVLQHPAVTAPIIGPRTWTPRPKSARWTCLSDGVLDGS